MSADASIELRELAKSDIPACSALLESLPGWFGLEDSNRAYIESLEQLPAAVAELAGDLAGFIALKEHNPRSVEILVMAVRRELHRQGVGTALMGFAEQWCRERGIPWLHVKTRGPSTPDPGYEGTRQFYLVRGFEPLFESLTIWGPGDAALVLVKHLAVT